MKLLNLDKPPPGPTGRTDTLVVRDLSVAYESNVVIRNVSLEIERGQVVGVIGPNGGGKSTLLKAILGIVPTVRGYVELFGQSADRMRAQMACVPQREAVEWTFPVTVADVVMMGRYPRIRWPHRPSSHDRAVVDTMLARVEMLEHRDTQIGQLSGGQQQRAFIARALAQEADVLLLDEPMTGIDASTQRVILAIIDAQRQAGKIVLLATHDLYSASQTCDHLCGVNERRATYGPTEEMYTAERLAETFGGPVIILGAEAAHHHHVHEYLCREHD